jgi:predicted DNA-binding transcriptional regulator AlpA
MRLNNNLLIGSIVAFLMMLSIGPAMAELSIAGDVAHYVAQHVSFLASNGEWHAGAIAIIANIKYLTTKQVAERYSIDPRSVQRRVKEGRLPPPVYLGTRFPRWDIAELDENDKKLASVRVPNVGAIAAAKANAAKPKPAEKPARHRPRKEHAAASTEQQNEMNT